MATRILVVDDSPTIRKVVASILEDNGYETVTAENGEDGLDKLHDGSVDLVLTDFVMPKMNGYQFCREVRADEQLKALPIVLMSAKGDKIRGQFVDQTGAVDAITKPFDPMGLIAVVEGALTKHEEGWQRQESAAPQTAEEEPPDSVDLKPGDVELSSDPGLRRVQVAQFFADGLSRVVLPDIVKAGAASEAGEDRLQAAIRQAVTPDRMGRLSALLRALDFGDEEKEVLAGDLSFISIAEVLQMLELQRQTGALNIAQPDAEITLYLRGGLLDFARSQGMPAPFRLGRYLVQIGAVTREDLTHFLNNRAGSKRLIGDALVQLGFTDEDKVQEALKLQTSELVYEVVGWKSGRFTFNRDVLSPEATLAQLGLPPGGIVMEGFRRVDEWRLIEGSFDFDEILKPDQVAIERHGDGSDLTETERRVLDAIDGERSVREVVASVGSNTFDVCKILYQFLNSRLVRRQAA